MLNFGRMKWREKKTSVESKKQEEKQQEWWRSRSLQSRVWMRAERAPFLEIRTNLNPHTVKHLRYTKPKLQDAKYLCIYSTIYWLSTFQTSIVRVDEYVPLYRNEAREFVAILSRQRRLSSQHHNCWIHCPSRPWLPWWEFLLHQNPPRQYMK